MKAESFTLAGQPALVRIVPPARRPGALGMIRAMLRNPIETWPRAVYERPLVQLNGRFGGTVTFICAPALIHRVMVDEPESFLRANAFRRALSPALGDAILTADGVRWRTQRRIAAPAFRHERIRSFLPAMLSAARDTRDRWASLADGTEIGLTHEMMQTTFAIIAQTMLSGRSHLDTGQIERSITNYLENLRWQVIYALVGLPERAPYPGRRKLEAANRFMRSEIERVVRERRASGQRTGDLIDLLLEARDPDTDAGLPDRDIGDNILTFISAGHETTALALTWTFYLLAKHPQVEARVRAEIATVCAGGELTPADVDRLKFTRQVVQEALRLYPPAGIIARKAAVDFDLGGTRIAAGSNVIVPVYAIHRHRDLWPDPDRFDPDNFLPEAVKARQRHAYIPFGAGARVCIGMGFALSEAVALLGVLLPEVRMTPLREDTLQMRLSITLRPSNGMPMSIFRA
jgi:cytochrome P450